MAASQEVQRSPSSWYVPALRIDPGVGNVGPHLAFEERLDILQEGHLLRVTKLRIGLEAAL